MEDKTVSEEKKTGLKKPNEMDLDLEANMRGLNNNIGKNRPKDYVIIEEEIELEIERQKEDQGKNQPAKVSDNTFIRDNNDKTSPEKDGESSDPNETKGVKKEKDVQKAKTTHKKIPL